MSTVRRPWASLWLVLALLGPASFALAQTTPVANSTEAAAEPPSFFTLMVKSSGLIGVVILFMSVYLVALIAWMAMQYRRSVALPERLLEDLRNLLDQRLYTEAFSRVSSDPSFLARVLTVGVKKLPSGSAQAQRAMELASDDVSMAMEHRTTYLATVGTLGPMIGLVGTVYGMIISFRVIASAGSSPQASLLAEGISIALFATLEGIALSIPAIYFHAVFRNRIARLALEVELAAEGLLEQFAPGVRGTMHPLATVMTPPSPGIPTRTALPPAPSA